MKKLVKGTSLLTAVSIGEMTMRFIRTKFIALFLGPAGTGFLAQLTIFFEALRVWGDLGSRRGVIKQVAEQRREGRQGARYREIISTSYFLALIASVATGIAVAYFARRISYGLYGNDSAVTYIQFLAVLLPFASVSTITASIVKGNLDFRPFAVYTLASYLVVMLVTPVLIYVFHFWGAVAVQGLFFIIPFAGYLIYNLKSRFLNFSPRISFHALKEQFSYGALQIYSDSFSNISRMLIASWIVKGLGLNVMGIFQVVITFSTVYLSIPIQAISGYTFPMIAAASTKEEINSAVNDSLRFLLFILVPVIAALMIWPEIFIRIFFSSEFLPAAPVLRLQLFGTLFTLIVQSYGAGLGARGELKAIFAGATAGPGLYILLSWLFFRHWALLAVAVSYSVACGVLCLLYVYFMRRDYGTHIFPKNRRLLAASFLWLLTACAGSFFFSSILYRSVMSSAGLIWFFVSSKDHERHFLYTKVKKFLSRERKPIRLS